MTGVTEDNVETFANNWTGTGAITGSGDGEKLVLSTGEYMDSQVVFTDNVNVQLRINDSRYGSGDVVYVKYRHANTQLGCFTASWNLYTVKFASLGWVQIRLQHDY